MKETTPAGTPKGQVNHYGTIGQDIMLLTGSLQFSFQMNGRNSLWELWYSDVIESLEILI